MPPELPPQATIMQMLLGKFVSRSLTAAAELALADHLKDGPRTAEDLARATGTNADAVYRMMRALAAVGVFRELPGRRFENNELSGVLRGDVQGSLRAMARWINEPTAWAAWGALDHSLRTGKAAAEHALGAPVFEYFAKNEATARIFNEAMTGFTAMTGRAAIEAYDFSGFARVVDVGGGHGALALLVQQRWPHLEVTVYDLPFVIEGTQEVIAAAGVAGRVRAVAGDFFEGVPAGADCYMMKHIIHDWSDEACVKILRHCREAMNPEGRVLVLDQVLTDGPEGVMGKLIDLEMLVFTPGGRERTAAEFATLFEHAGLKLNRVVPTQSPICIVEATGA
jgi:hypothetical protein